MFIFRNVDNLRKKKYFFEFSYWVTVPNNLNLGLQRNNAHNFQISCP